MAASHNGHNFFGLWAPKPIRTPFGPHKARPLVAGLIKIKAQAASTSNIDDRSAVEMVKSRMSQTHTWLCRKGPFVTWSLRRCLVLLLVLAVSTAGLFHLPMGEHMASATSFSHDVASVDQLAADESHCDSDAAADHDGTCCTASTCSFCVPLMSSALITRAAIAHLIARLPDEAHVGRASPPDLRPPKLSANI